MNLFVIVACVSECIGKHLVFLYCPGFTFDVYLYQVLENNPASPDIQVPHFRVSHLPLGKAYILTACQQF